MKMIVFILTMLICHPFSAEAETVFNETQSFQVAKTVKLGREKGNINKNSVTKKTVNKSRAAEKGEQYKGCAREAFWSEDDGKCIPVCDGTTCKTGYEKHLIGDRCYCY